MDSKEIVEICKALADENRLNIIQILTKGKRCGCDLLEELNITQPTLSHHMKILNDCGLVDMMKEGKWHHYSINCERFRAFKDAINQMSCIEMDCCCEKK